MAMYRFKFDKNDNPWTDEPQEYLFIEAPDMATAYYKFVYSHGPKHNLNCEKVEEYIPR